MTNVADLTDYDVCVPIAAASGYRRHINVRLPATTQEAAHLAGGQLGLAISEATDHTYKMANGVAATPCRSSIYPEHEDRWSREIAPHAHLAIDQGGCFVLRFAGTSVTVTNLALVVEAMMDARQARDAMEQQESGR